MTQPEWKPCDHKSNQEFIAFDGIRCGQCFMDECWRSRDLIEKLNAEIKALKQDNLGCKEIREQMDGLNKACDSFRARADAYREVAILDAGLILKLKNQPINEVLATRFVDEKADKILAKGK